MDFYVRKAVANLPHLRDLGDQINRKLLEVERLSHHCVLTEDALDRSQHPMVADGQRVSALRFGDPRVMALFQSMCAFTQLPRGFRNRDLRPHVEALLGRPSTALMTYDLWRLRLKGLIHRIPKTHRSTATSYGLKVAFFYAKALSWHPQAETGPRCSPMTIPCRAHFGPPSTSLRRDSETPRGGRHCCLKNLLQPVRSHA